MAKLTKRRVLDAIELTCNVQDWDAWNDKNGDAERTKVNHLMGLVSVKDCLNTISVFETHYPDGVAEVVEEYKEKYAKFREQFIKTYPDDFIAYALVLDLSPLGATKYNPKKDPAEEVKKFCGELNKDESVDDEVVKTSEYAGKTLRELRKLCRERNITVPSGATADDLIALLEEFDESEDNDLGSDVEEEQEEEEQDDDSSESESEAESEDVLSYDEMETSELRAECKKRGIEFSKNTKAHVLIDLLVEDDKKSESTEESDEEVDELDEILDEEFVDEEIEAAAKDEEESKSARGKRNKK